MADPTWESTSHGPEPSPELRERVLGQCRREMAARVAGERRWQRQWRLGFATVAAGLLLLNGLEEHRTGGRIQQLLQGPNRVIVERDAPAPGSLRARMTLLAALLNDPNAL